MNITIRVLSIERTQPGNMLNMVAFCYGKQYIGVGKSINDVRFDICHKIHTVVGKSFSSIDVSFERLEKRVENLN